MNAFKTIFFLLLISSFSFGQTSTFSLELVASPDYYLSNFAVASHDFPDQKYSSKLGYSAGLKAWYQVAQRVALGIGLTYSRKEYQLTYNYRVRESGDPLIERNTLLKSSYAEVPISVKYVFVTAPKYTLYATTGLTSNFLLSTKEKTTYEDGHTTTAERGKNKVTTFLLSSSLSLGASYYFNSKLGLFIEPEYRYYFKKMDATAYKSNSMQLSFRLGTVIRF